jgi:hypothetical protein
MSEEKLSLFYPLQDGSSETTLLTRWHNSSTKYAYKSGIIRPKKGSITVDYHPSSSNSQRDTSHGRHQDVPSPQRKPTSSRDVTMWDVQRERLNRQTDQASTSSALDKDKQLISKTREVSENDDISDEWQKCFDKVVVGYKEVLRKLNDNEKVIEEYFSPLEKEFIKTNGKEQKQYIEELEKEFGVVKELHEKVGDLLKNNKVENGDKAKKGKEVEEELQEFRIKFLKFLEAKIKNSSDKKETFGSWAGIMDRLYSDRELIKEGYYNVVGRDIVMVHNPIFIINENPDKIKEKYCNKNDQIYNILTSICDSLYPEFKEQELLRELRARIEDIERHHREQHNADGISVMFMRTQEIAKYSNLLSKEVKRCIDQGEQVEQLRRETKKLYQGLEKYSRHIGVIEDPQQRFENLQMAHKNVYDLNAIFKEYDKQKKREKWLRRLSFGRRG